MWMDSFDHPNDPMRSGLLFFLSYREETGTERLSNLPKVTELYAGRKGMCIC